MKVTLVAVILLTLLLPSGLSASSSSHPYWKGGLSVTLDGFGVHDAFNDGEYAGVHLYIDPFQRNVLSPSLSAGTIFPIFPSGMKDFYADIHAAVVLTTVRNQIFLRPSMLAPRIQAGALVPASGFQDALVSFLAEPLNFFFGEKYVSILGFRLLYDPVSRETTWGMRLFDVSHMFF